MLGDRNTHFFHLSTIIRRKHNRITLIKDEVGISYSTIDGIYLLFLNYYKICFSSELDNPLLPYYLAKILTVVIVPLWKS